MAVKYFCDGCDRETSTKRISVLIEKAELTASPSPTEPNVKPAFQIFDLCAACEDGLRDWANPKTWVRSKPPEPEETGHAPAQEHM